MERIDLGVFGGRQVVGVVALNRLVEEWQADEEDDSQQ